MRILFLCILSLFYIGCVRSANIHTLSASSTQNPTINLGTLQHIEFLNTQQSKKPRKEIARICHSFFFSDSYREYEILSLSNLILEAKKKTGRESFENVGIWHKNWNLAYIWQKKCLIMGE